VVWRDDSVWNPSFHHSLAIEMRFKNDNFQLLFMSDSIKIKLDGEEIDLNPFVNKIFKKIIRGMLESLDGISGAKKVEIEINYEKELDEDS